MVAVYEHFIQKAKEREYKLENDKMVVSGVLLCLAVSRSTYRCAE